MRRSVSKPFVRAWRQIVVRPVTVFAAWSADHASHVARSRQNELDWPGIQMGRRIGRFPWRNVVFARRQNEGRRRNFRQVDRGIGESDTAGFCKEILLIHLT